MSVFGCEHKWEIITEKTIPNSLVANGVKGVTQDFMNELKDTYILVLKCQECGQLNKTVEKV